MLITGPLWVAQTAFLHAALQRNQPNAAYHEKICFLTMSLMCWNTKHTHTQIGLCSVSKHQRLGWACRGGLAFLKLISATFPLCDTFSCGICYSYQDYAGISCCAFSRSAGGRRNAFLSELMRAKGQSFPHSGCHGNVWDSGRRRTRTSQRARLHGAHHVATGKWIFCELNTQTFLFDPNTPLRLNWTSNHI